MTFAATATFLGTYGTTIAYVGSAVVSATGAVYAGQKTKQSQEYNAQLAENQAEMESLEAREAIKRQREENKSILSRQRAMRAKSGVSIEEGSSLIAAAEAAERLELQTLEMSRTSEGRQQQLLSQAKMDRITGQAAATTSYLQAGSSLLSGGEKIANFRG